MYKYSKNVLPPILEYSYPAFRFANNDGGAVQVTLPAILSKTNTMSQIDHMQVRIVSLDTNRNGLNRNLFPDGVMYIDLKGRSDVNIVFDTVVNGTNIFSMNGEKPYSSYYKIQIRLMEISPSFSYNASMGQKMTSDWILQTRKFTSEWSNSAKIKTAPRPDVGMFGLTLGGLTVLERPDYIFQGWYKTSDQNENLQSYRFTLEASDSEYIEDTGEIIIEEYDNASIQYRFKEIFRNDVTYTLTLYTTSATGYTNKETFLIEFDLSFIKLYNIFTVDENDDGAYNQVSMNAKQITLVATVDEQEDSWKSDASFDAFGEIGVTHYYLTNGEMKTNTDFSIPYDTFTFLLSVTNLGSKVQNRMIDCLLPQNRIFSFKGEGGVLYVLGVYKNFIDSEWVYKFVLKEEYGSGDSKVTNYFQESFTTAPAANKEYIFIIQKNRGDTLFEVAQWLTNIFR